MFVYRKFPDGDWTLSILGVTYLHWPAVKLKMITVFNKTIWQRLPHQWS